MAAKRNNVFALLMDDAEDATESSVDRAAVSKAVKKNTNASAKADQNDVGKGKKGGANDKLKKRDDEWSGDVTTNWSGSDRKSPVSSFRGGRGRGGRGAGRGGREGGRGGGRGVSREGGRSRSDYRSRDRNGYDQDRDRGYDDRRPHKREFDRRSGTGRGREARRAGRGPHGYGNEVEEAREAENVANWEFHSGGGEWGAIEAVERVASGDTPEAAMAATGTWGDISTAAAENASVKPGPDWGLNEEKKANEGETNAPTGDWGVSNGTGEEEDGEPAGEGDGDSPKKSGANAEPSMSYDEYLAQLAEKKEAVGAKLLSTKGRRKPNEGNSFKTGKVSVLKKELTVDSDASILGVVGLKQNHEKVETVDSTLNAVRNNLESQKFFQDSAKGGRGRFQGNRRGGRGGYDGERDFGGRGREGERGGYRGRGRGRGGRRDYDSPRSFGQKYGQAPNMDDTSAFPTLGA